MAHNPGVDAELPLSLGVENSEGVGPKSDRVESPEPAGGGDKDLQSSSFQGHSVWASAKQLRTRRAAPRKTLTGILRNVIIIQVGNK